MKINGLTIRRTYFEVPTMDERKWSKIPDIPADVFMADIEDSVPPNLKDAARDKVVGLVKDPSFYDGREFICRTNSLETSWGREDLEALAEAGAPFVLYPKARSAEEVAQVVEILGSRGHSSELHLIIETPQAVMRLEELASVEGVHGLLLGPGDLALETGTSLFDGPNVFHDGFTYARSKTLTVARALNLEASEGLLVADLKNHDDVQREARRSTLSGFTGNMTFYPPQVALINAVRTPTEGDVTWARRAVEAFQEAQDQGVGAITVDGRWVTVHQYGEAQQAIAVADALGIEPVSA